MVLVFLFSGARLYAKLRLIANSALMTVGGSQGHLSTLLIDLRLFLGYSGQFLIQTYARLC